MVVQDPSKHIIGTKALVENAVHFGHKSSRRNPKMNKYIYSKKSDFHVINLSKTLDCIAEAYNFLKTSAEQGNLQVIFVGTKPKAKKIIAEEAIRCQELFIDERWLGGTLTNSRTINKRMLNWARLEAQKQTGFFDQLTKKESMLKTKEIERLSKFFRGIRKLKGFPTALFVVDVEKEKTAIAEAKKFNIPVIAMVNTNVDPSLVTYPIPANDESEKSINIITSLMADAIIEGKKLQTETGEPVAYKFAYSKESFEPIQKREHTDADGKPEKRDFHKFNKNKPNSNFVRKPYRPRFEERMLNNNKPNSFTKPSVSSETTNSNTPKVNIEDKK